MKKEKWTPSHSGVGGMGIGGSKALLTFIARSAIREEKEVMGKEEEGKAGDGQEDDNSWSNNE